MKFNIIDEANKTFDIKFILKSILLSTYSWGSIVKTYKLINETLSSSDTIAVHKYIRLFKRKENIFDAPSRLLLSVFATIQKDKKLATFLRQLILYQIIYTNTYLLVAEYLSFSEDISHVATGRRSLTETNYKDIRKIAEKVAGLLYKKNINSVNLIANAYLHKNNYLFPDDIPTSKLFKKAVDFNMKRSALLELNKIYIADKINLLKNITETDNELSPNPDISHNTNLHPFGTGSKGKRSIRKSNKANTLTNITTTDDNLMPEPELNSNEFIESIIENVDESTEYTNDKLVKRNVLLNFYKCIFQYNLALTSFDIENILDYCILDNTVICNETQDILDFYKLDQNTYELYMPIELTKRIYFLEY